MTIPVPGQGPYQHATRVPNPTTATFSCGKFHTLRFDENGALSQLAFDVDGVNTSLATTKNAVGLYQYQTFVNEDYNVFLQDFTERVQGRSYRACPSPRYKPGAPDDLDCRNFRKPNVSHAHPIHAVYLPTLRQLWRVADSNSDVSDSDTGSNTNTARMNTNTDTTQCQFLLQLDMDADAHRLAGAPERLVVLVNVSAGVVRWDVVQVKKTPTRLPESSFFSFVPDVDKKGWRMQVLGSWMSPTDVVGSRDDDSGDDSGDASGDGTNRGAGDHSPVYGGSPHLLGIESASWSSTGQEGETMSPKFALTLSSLDVPVVSAGSPSPFPSPRTEAPDMDGGIHFNIFQNLWNTNYVLWYPFREADRHLRSRFELEVT